MAQGPEGREDGELRVLGLQTGGWVKGTQGWGLWRLKANKETLGSTRQCSPLPDDGTGQGSLRVWPWAWPFPAWSLMPWSALPKHPLWSVSRDSGGEVGMEDISDARTCFPKTMEEE